jgi:KDO2-lipid IV(A) lauroyltransferase
LEHSEKHKEEEPYFRPPGPDEKAKPVHYLQYGAAKSLMFALRVLPYGATKTLGNMIGSLAHALDKKHRKIALLNLDVAFGDTLPERRKREIVKAHYQHFGRALLETLRLPKITAQNYRHFMDVEGLDLLKEVAQSDTGALLYTAHYGNWEYMNLALGFMGLPMSVMARPIDNPLIHKLIEQLRNLSGNEIIYKHKSARKVLNAIKAGRIIGIVGDQNVHDRNRIMVPFFNKEATCTPMPAAMAYKCNVPIICGFSQPAGPGRYVLKFGPIIKPDPEAEKNAEIQRITAELNRVLEDQIRLSPESWFWVHKRFKTGPDGETSFYRQARSV